MVECTLDWEFTVQLCCIWGSLHSIVVSNIYFNVQTIQEHIEIRACGASQKLTKSLKQWLCLSFINYACFLLWDLRFVLFFKFYELNIVKLNLVIYYIIGEQVIVFIKRKMSYDQCSITWLRNVLFITESCCSGSCYLTGTEGVEKKKRGKTAASPVVIRFHSNSRAVSSRQRLSVKSITDRKRIIKPPLSFTWNVPPTRNEGPIRVNSTSIYTSFSPQLKPEEEVTHIVVWESSKGEANKNHNDEEFLCFHTENIYLRSF